MSPLGPQSSKILAALDFTSEQHRVIQRNLANLNTPGFKAKTLRFDEALESAVMEERQGINPRQDGNTVVLEIENAEMRKNALVYRLFLQAMASETRTTRAAIAGRSQ
ncbi:MAG: hypothetical protein CMJ83_02865 [Planctomycetes bacterium]|jgi:flagellar basal-body rod protein FlgB|nr:hypothetical protein [Planctomycetota bacterium]